MAALNTVVPNLFGTTDQFPEGKPFHWQGEGAGEQFWMTQTHYIYCALYFYYYYVISTSDHQALDPRGWGPLL